MNEAAKQSVIEIIRPLWDEYTSGRILSILKAGKWEHTPLINGVKPPQHIDGTRAETRPLKSIMGFPTFLERKWTPKS